MDQQSGIFIALPFILLIVALRMWRGTRARKMRIEQMWIRPAIIFLILALSVASQPPPLEILVILALVLATGAGFAFGWWRARFVNITIDVGTHQLTGKQSPWGMLIFIAIMVVRLGARYALGGADDFNGLPVAAIVDALTLFYGGVVMGTQLEVYLRARKLLADTIAAKAAGKLTPNEVSQDHA
jgi:hypothetical protein